MANIRLAGCIICDEDGGVLVIHRSTPGRTQWEIPYGGVNEHEDTQVAAIRGLKEQMGVDVKIVRQLGARTIAKDANVYGYAWFLAEIVSGEPAIRKPESYNKWGYFSLVSLTQRYDELSPNTKSFLEAMAYGEIDLDV